MIQRKKVTKLIRSTKGLFLNGLRFLGDCLSGD